MPTSRGTITARVGPKEAEVIAKARERRPVKRAQAADSDPLVRFQTTGKRPVRNLTLKIVHLPDGVDAGDDERTDAILAYLKTDRLHFHDWALTTKDQPVIAWLRGRIYRDRLPGVEEDMSGVDIPCPHPGCDFKAKNTAEGRKALGKHAYLAHGDNGARGRDADVVRGELPDEDD
jgi:hypothetical protein